MRRRGGRTRQPSIRQREAANNEAANNAAFAAAFASANPPADDPPAVANPPDPEDPNEEEEEEVELELPAAADDEEKPPAPQPQAHQNLTVRSSHETYKSTMVTFMNWLHAGANYDASTTFTPQIVSGITANDFYRWCKFRVYDDPDADETITPPVRHRDGTVAGWKKHVSHFMSNQNMQWNEVAGVGNPTRSNAISKLIKNMKRMQTRRLGVPSQARRALTNGEYERLQGHYWRHEDRETSICASAVAAVQVHLIGRNDDVCHIVAEDLWVYEAFPNYCLSVRMAWSKNVMGERDAPRQVLMGAMEPKYCVLLNLALWLETCGEVNIFPNGMGIYYSLHLRERHAPFGSNAKCRLPLRRVWSLLQKTSLEMWALIRLGKWQPLTRGLMAAQRRVFLQYYCLFHLLSIHLVHFFSILG